MKAISRGLLLFFLFISMFMFGQFQSSKAGTIEEGTSLSPLNFHVEKVYKPKFIVVDKALKVSVHGIQFFNEPNSGTEESDDCEGTEIQYTKHKSSIVYFSLLEKQFESSIKIKYQNLQQAKSEAPKVSLFILFHSWKSYDAQILSV